MAITVLPAPSPTGAPNGALAVPLESIWRLTVDQYHEMIGGGILTEDDPVELLEGWLITKMSKNPTHPTANGLIADAMRQLAPPGWRVRVQDPITLLRSEPEPDVSLVRGALRDYLDRHPGPTDVALVVEVADTTLERDRNFKKQIYARASIPIYWIANLIDHRIEVYTDPTGDAPAPDYRKRKDFLPGDVLPLIVDGVEVARLPVADLLP